ncbi:hypothetical protein LEMLEM_LOCUS20534, partial [Lemmus lemmus]
SLLILRASLEGAMGGRPAGLLCEQAHLFSVCSLIKCLLRTCIREPIKSSPSQPKQEENTGCLEPPVSWIIIYFVLPTLLGDGNHQSSFIIWSPE